MSYIIKKLALLISYRSILCVNYNSFIVFNYYILMTQTSFSKKLIKVSC